MIGPRVGSRAGGVVGAAAGPGADSLPSSTVGDLWTLVKTGGTNSVYDAQAYTQSFAGTVTVSFTISAPAGGGDAYCVGLSADNPDADYAAIDFGLLNDVTSMFRVENNTLTALGSTTAGDVWQVTRTAGTGAVTYYKNGSLVSTSSNTSTAALIVDSSIRFTGDNIIHVGVTTPTGGELLTWTTSGVTMTKE